MLKLGTCRRVFREAVREEDRKKWKSVVGLEVHSQISSVTKLFSKGRASYPDGAVNTGVSLFDAAIPGTLPVLNRRCVEAAVSTSLALDCEVNTVSTFERKHYFYSDLPAGYQITQQSRPLAKNGSLSFWVFGKSAYQSRARITQLQLETDSGKSLHDPEGCQSLIDLNRCGMALMEIVFAPDISSGEEAVALIKELRSILTKVSSCTCKMEDGALRVDANISVHRPGTDYGVRTEVKNLNSTRSLFYAIEYEIERQISVLESGGTVINETRGFDDSQRVTVPMRDKEVEQDYRFVPEPNLLPLRLRDSSTESKSDSGDLIDIDYFRRNLPVMPDVLRKSIIEEHGIQPSIANFLVNEPVIYSFYTRVVEVGVPNVKILISVLTTTIREFIKNGNDLETSGLTPKICASIIDARFRKLYSFESLDKALSHYLQTPEESLELFDLIKKHSWNRIDNAYIDTLVDQALKDNHKKVSKYIKGKEKELAGISFNVRKQFRDHAHLSNIMERLKLKLLEMKARSS